MFSILQAVEWESWAFFTRDQGDRLPVELGLLPPATPGPLPFHHPLSNFWYPNERGNRGIWWRRRRKLQRSTGLENIPSWCSIFGTKKWLNDLKPSYSPAFHWCWLCRRLIGFTSACTAGAAIRQQELWKTLWERVFHIRIIRSWLDRNRILIDFLTFISKNIYYMFPFCGWFVLTLYNTVRTVLWCAGHDWLSLWSYLRTVFIKLG
jgi:hypothetical protein